MQRLVYNPGPLANPSIGTIALVVLGVGAVGLAGYGLYRHFTKPALPSEPQRVS